MKSNLIFESPGWLEEEGPNRRGTATPDADGRTPEVGCGLSSFE